MKVEVTDAPFDPWQVAQAYQQAHPAWAGRYGATALFIGTLRDFSGADRVRAMTLEHYPGMTEKYLESLSQQAADRWNLLDTLIVHRVGQLLPDEPIVLVAVWSAQRKDAFEASRFLMEELKSRAPFWKKEELDSGSRWVEQNTPG